MASIIAKLGNPQSVWLLQDGEPLPTDDSPRLMRTGDQVRRLVEAGYAVIWWTSRFSHNLKRFRASPSTWCAQDPRYKIALLDGPGYKRNISWQRMRHYRAIAAHFYELSQTLPPPALILASYPSPELCDAGRRYACQHNVPFVVDIRDPWPDIFPDYLPNGLRWSLVPILWHYRQKMRAIARDAEGIVAVSKEMLEWGIHYAGRARTKLDQVFHIGYPRQPQDRKIAVPALFTPDEPMVCLFATTCGKSYEGEMLIDAVRILESTGERRIRFVVSGDGDMRPLWVTRAKGLTSVHFTGWIPHEELQEYFRTAHLGLVLIKGGIARFWLGNKIFEYLSAFLGLVNDVPGEADEIVAKHDLGVNVGRENPLALANTLRALASDPERVRRYMENAKEAFYRHFDRETVETKYVDHLQAVIRLHRERQGGNMG